MMSRVDAIVTHRLTVVAMLLMLAVLTGALPAAQSAAVQAWYRLSPVMQDWQVQSIQIDGADVVIAGTVRKRWACSYQPPPRAHTDVGAPLIVESTAPVPGASWPTSDQAMQWGPWRIRLAAGQRVILYHHHVCGDGHDVFTKLGVIDTTHERIPR
jgi:hypothetical protein